ncbi:hypothetical protein F8172_17035 [Bacillus cereus]|uniref:Uncharacterized protein n=1 Tax=Bacillus cereus TaxID=1396 RepID=A0A9W7QEG3_BACCE|nr:hypothetical protein F8172_17035 [Bacillus cereus]KAB2407421.1 hypothetical protein F8170_11070 [Bacillus cereus]KAB2428581.1 hypothetical protein F8168_17385 [Bacillus cereus]
MKKIHQNGFFLILINNNLQNIYDQTSFIIKTSSCPKTMIGIEVPTFLSKKYPFSCLCTTTAKGEAQKLSL